jgi:predicted dinucleotide-binding enzyme
MKIGILGAGNVGGTLGQGWARSGHDIVFGVRTPSSDEVKQLLSRCAGHATAGTASDAAASDVVVNALPWQATQSTLEGLNLSGKVLLDCANPLLPDLSGLSVGTTTSGGEMVASWAKGARVVKIFNSTGYNNMANPVYAGQPIPMFYCGDDAAGKQTAAQLARDIGFNPIDAGPLLNARVLEPHAMLWIWMAIKGGFGSDFAFTIAKR